jgi:arginine transport system substrate-binding protein
MHYIDNIAVTKALKMSKSFKKYLVIFTAVLTVATAIFMNLIQTTAKPAEDTLTIGLETGYPPFVYIDKNGEIVGFDIDVGERIAAKLGKKLVLKNMDFDGEILALKQDKIDLIMSGINITPSREKEILMVPYHGNTATSLSLIFWKTIPEGVHSIEDLMKIKNSTVTVGSGTIPESYMTNYPSIQAKSFEGALACLMDVKYGKSVANLVEPDVAEYQQTQHPEVKILSVPLLQNANIGGFGIGINKNNQTLFEQVKASIQELKATGELKQLEDKWFKGTNQ